MTSVKDLRVVIPIRNNIPFILYVGFLLRPVIGYFIDLNSVSFFIGIICFTCTVASFTIPLLFSCNRKLNYLAAIGMTLIISYPTHIAIEYFSSQKSDSDQVVTFLQVFCAWLLYLTQYLIEQTTR